MRAYVRLICTHGAVGDSLSNFPLTRTLRSMTYATNAFKKEHPYGLAR